jgi:hypothetical protein
MARADASQASLRDSQLLAQNPTADNCPMIPKPANVHSR